MRTAFITEFIQQARLHPELFLAVGDLGFSVVEPFAAEFPDRFLNAGVAEQNMTGVAAGLASEGYHVFTYSIANFPTLRCLEQIRNDVCYHNLPVTVVSVGAGFSYGNLGYSHHAVQDIGAMRSLPNMTVLSPADPGEARECLQWLTTHPGPSYLRLGKAGEARLHDVTGVDRGPLLVSAGTGHTAIVATGSILQIALEAARNLAEKGRRVPVYSLPWLKPLTRGFLAPLSGFKQIVAIEEHVEPGGLADLLREQLPRLIVHSVSVPETVAQKVGSQRYLREHGGMDAKQVLEQMPD